MERLRDFPKRGVCWDHTAELVSFLTKRGNLHINPNLQSYHTHPPKGVAWSEASCWGVSVSSHQPEYYIEQLIPFLPSKFNRALTPMTPEECYAMPKFCLKINQSNAGLIKDYLLYHKDEYVGWLESWEPMQALGLYFCCSQETKSCYADIRPPKGYFQITNDSFLKHVLTHTDKQQQINEPKTEENGKQESTSRAIKVQRPHLTVRDTGPIGATGIRCPKIQVKIGSGHLPD